MADEDPARSPSEAPGPVRYPEPPLRDDAIRLRAPRLEDIDAIVAACTDPESQRWLPLPRPYRPADAEWWIETASEEWATGGSAHFAIADGVDDALIGAISIHPPKDRRAFVGYWVAPWARRRGVATRALSLVSRWGVRELGLVRLALYADVGNLASQKVAVAANFRREGVLRNYTDDRDGPRDCVMFSLVPADLADGRE